MVGPAMKLPKETITIPVVLLKKPTDARFNLGLLEEHLKENPHISLSDIWVEFRSSFYEEDQVIEVIGYETRINPNYEEEVRAYEAHHARLLAEKLEMKHRAMADLLKRAATIQHEIDDMKAALPKDFKDVETKKNDH